MRRLDQEVEVVVHQAERQATPTAPSDNGAQHGQIRPAIAIVDENHPAHDPSGVDVMDRSGLFVTWRISHATCRQIGRSPRPPEPRNLKTSEIFSKRLRGL